MGWAGVCRSVRLLVRPCLSSLHGLFLAGYTGNSRTRFQSGTCTSCAAQTSSQICRSTSGTHLASAEGGAAGARAATRASFTAPTLSPGTLARVGYLSSQRTELTPNSPPRPGRRGSLAPLSGRLRPCAECAEQKPPEAEDPAALGGWRHGVGVHLSVCTCASFDVPG